MGQFTRGYTHWPFPSFFFRPVALWSPRNLVWRSWHGGPWKCSFLATLLQHALGKFQPWHDTWQFFLQIKVVGLSEIDCVFQLIWKLDLCSAESRLYRWGQMGMGTDDDSQTVSAFHQGFNLQWGNFQIYLRVIPTNWNFIWHIDSDILSGILFDRYSDILQCPLRSGTRGWGPAVPAEEGGGQAALLIRSRV